MFKIYSTVTNEYYDTQAEAEAAEKAVSENSNRIKELENRIVDINEQKANEIRQKRAEFDEVMAQLQVLSNKKIAIENDMNAINSEAAMQITDINKQIHSLKTNDSHCCKCKCNADKPKDQCTIQIKTYDSESSGDNKWKTVIDKSGTYADVINELENLIKNNPEFNINNLIKYI